MTLKVGTASETAIGCSASFLATAGLLSWVYTGAVPRTQSQIGDRSFTAAEPRLCNNLHV